MSEQWKAHRSSKGAAVAEPPAAGDGDLPDRAELRRRVVDRVIDAGGEVSTAIVSGGTVLVRGRVGCRSEIPMLERELLCIPGVTELELHLGYDIDDVGVVE
ncbi:MAG: hypothetical protein HOW97_04775 [Catenulispora sp.]|nr:hypothetical protein [Catenulispora sp.]